MQNRDGRCGVGMQAVGTAHRITAQGVGWGCGVQATSTPSALSELVGAGQGLPHPSASSFQGAPWGRPCALSLSPSQDTVLTSPLSHRACHLYSPSVPSPAHLVPYAAGFCSTPAPQAPSCTLVRCLGLAPSTPSTHMPPLQAPLWQLLCHQHHSTLLGTAWHSTV